MQHIVYIRDKRISHKLCLYSTFFPKSSTINNRSYRHQPYKYTPAAADSANTDQTKRFDHFHIPRCVARSLFFGPFFTPVHQTHVEQALYFIEIPFSRAALLARRNVYSFITSCALRVHHRDSPSEALWIFERKKIYLLFLSVGGVDLVKYIWLQIW